MFGSRSADMITSHIISLPADDDIRPSVLTAVRPPVIRLLIGAPIITRQMSRQRVTAVPLSCGPSQFAVATAHSLRTCGLLFFCYDMLKSCLILLYFQLSDFTWFLSLVKLLVGFYLWELRIEGFLIDPLKVKYF